MQLTLFTDLGLRVLIDLATTSAQQSTTIADIAGRFGVAHNHLTKVVQFMGQQGWLFNARGKGGGIRLAWPIERYRLGELVRTLEPANDLIDCNRPPCVLSGRCELKSLLTQAEKAFYESLNQHTLADIVQGGTKKVMLQLHSSWRVSMAGVQ